MKAEAVGSLKGKQIEHTHETAVLDFKIGVGM